MVSSGSIVVGSVDKIPIDGAGRIGEIDVVSSEFTVESSVNDWETYTFLYVIACGIERRKNSRKTQVGLKMH